MTQNQSWKISNFSVLAKNMVVGALIGFVAVGLFLLWLYIMVGDLDFGKLIYLPFVTVSFGGACGGIFYYLMGYFRQFGTWQKVVAHIISFLVYFVSLWLSLVMALAATGHWD